MRTSIKRYRITKETKLVIKLIILIAILVYALHYTNKHYSISDISQNFREVAKEEDSQPLSELLVDEMPSYTMLGDYRITFYCDCEKCQEQWVGQTASGMELEDFYTIATSDEFEFGTKLYINIFGCMQEFVVADRGGGIKDNCIDIYVGDASKHELANDLGVIYTQVFIKN